eukprot:1764379-Prymnesium_polylepis.5
MVFELSGATIGTKSHSKLAMLVMSCEITDLAFPCAAICLVDAAGLQHKEGSLQWRFPIGNMTL